ncbi:Arm DNA-binding domain-containing protein [Klebsiella quasipneumoniae subsp. similipneumoniae]
MPSGSRYWRMKYRFNGKRNVWLFGVYPAVSLAQARRYVMKPRKTGRGYRSIVCQERRKAGSGCAAP